MVELRLTPAEAGNIVSQLPAAARQFGSGILYVHDDGTEDGIAPDMGTLHVPDEFAAAAQSADKTVLIVRRSVPKAEIVALVAAAQRSADFMAAISANPDATLTWSSLTEFPSDDGPVATILTSLGVVVPAAPGPVA